MSFLFVKSLFIAFLTKASNSVQIFSFLCRRWSLHLSRSSIIMIRLSVLIDLLAKLLLFNSIVYSKASSMLTPGKFSFLISAICLFIQSNVRRMSSFASFLSRSLPFYSLNLNPFCSISVWKARPHLWSHLYRLANMLRTCV